jgi:hypothetical protein
MPCSVLHVHDRTLLILNTWSIVVVVKQLHSAAWVFSHLAKALSDQLLGSFRRQLLASFLTVKPAACATFMPGYDSGECLAKGRSWAHNLLGVIKGSLARGRRSW